MEIILEIPNTPFCKMSKEAEFCCALSPKAATENTSLLESNETTQTLPRKTPQTLLALRKDTGPFTSKVSVWKKNKKFLFVNGSVTHNKFSQHVIGISGPFFSSELQAYFSSCLLYTFTEMSHRFLWLHMSQTELFPNSPLSCPHTSPAHLLSPHLSVNTTL